MFLNHSTVLTPGAKSNYETPNTILDSLQPEPSDRNISSQHQSANCFREGNARADVACTNKMCDPLTLPQDHILRVVSTSLFYSQHVCMG